MPSIKSRIVLHFPGFEPLDSTKHRERFVRASAQTSKIWNCTIESGDMQKGPGGSSFQVDATGANWATHTVFHVFDLAEHIAELQRPPLPVQLASGYAAFLKVIWFGGIWNYFRHAWRFALFAIFPFLLMSFGLFLGATIFATPFLLELSAWHSLWSMPLAVAFFFFGFMPFAERFHTMLLFNDWRCAVDFATLRSNELNARLATISRHVRAALNKRADEYLITSHSIGGMTAVHVIGKLIEDEPEFFAGKKLVFASVGSGILQGALMRPAKILRQRACSIAASPNIFWFDVQCLTDISHFYKTKVANLCGYIGDRQPNVAFIRIKAMLNRERYHRIKSDFLRVHRQYVLGNDVKANYDFGLMCAGALPAATFATLPVSVLPPFNDDGSIRPD